MRGAFESGVRTSSGAGCTTVRWMHAESGSSATRTSHTSYDSASAEPRSGRSVRPWWPPFCMPNRLRRPPTALMPAAPLASLPRSAPPGEPGEPTPIPPPDPTWPHLTPPDDSNPTSPARGASNLTARPLLASGDDALCSLAEEGDGSALGENRLDWSAGTSNCDEPTSSQATPDDQRSGAPAGRRT